MKARVYAIRSTCASQPNLARLARGEGNMEAALFDTTGTRGQGDLIKPVAAFAVRLTGQFAFNYRKHKRLG